MTYRLIKDLEDGGILIPRFYLRILSILSGAYHEHLESLMTPPVSVPSEIDDIFSNLWM
jgi:hypothetical protein